MKDSLLPNSAISHYRILARLGAGGMGEVYLAEDTQLGRKVAIKFLAPESVADEQAKKRLLREARAAATLDHPNICTIHEVGEEAGQSFIVMQYVEGETLAARIKRRPLELQESLAVAVQVAEALQEAHAHHIVHRDIKPQNIMLTPRGQVKVLDFGLAKMMREPAIAESEAETASRLTESGAVVGTVLYMSPEQVRGEELDGRSDIFSFGVVFYEMVSGHQPFAAPSAAEIFSAILTREPLPLQRYAAEATTELERIVRKCLEKDRERRYQTTRDLAIDLESVRRECETGRNARSGDEQRAASGAAAVTGRPTMRHSVLTSWRALTLVAVMLLVVAGLGYWWLWRGAPAKLQPEIRSLAVLPLKPLNRADSDDYLGLGLTNAIITRASQMGTLIVRPINAVQPYQDQKVDPLEAARKLQVDSVLDSTWQRVGNKLRISVHLLRTSDGATLWAGNVDREMNDLFALEDDISLQVAKALNLALTTSEEKQLASPPTKNPEAYDYYLRGKFYQSKTQRNITQGAENLSSAIEMFERATALDPNFALAYVALANACTTKLFSFDPNKQLENKQLEEKAYVAIENALALNQNLAEAYLARGNLLWTLANNFPHERAVKEIRRALAINPNLAQAHSFLGSVYFHIGLLDKALEESATARRLNPTGTNSNPGPGAGRIHRYQQKYELALSEFEKSPGWEDEKGLLLWHLGRTSEALAVLEERLKNKEAQPNRTQADIFAAYAVVLASLGQQQKAGENIRYAIENGQGTSHFHHAEVSIACAYAVMGKNQLAVKWLQKAADHGLPCYPLFEKESALNNLRNDPQFMAFMAKLKKQREGYLATL